MFLYPFFKDREPPQPPAGLEGLGDMVAVIAQPIAKGIDAIFHTDIQNCAGCQQRQDWLNEQFPLQPPR